MSCREHSNRIHVAPQVYTEEISTTGEGDEIFMSQIPEVKDFKTIIAHLKLKPGDDAEAANLPIALKAYAVADPDDAAGTRVQILEKCLDGITDWSGYMFLEVGETHIGQYLGESSSGEFPNLYFSVEGPTDVDYDLVVVLMDPYFQGPQNLLEENT